VNNGATVSYDIDTNDTTYDELFNTSNDFLSSTIREEDDYLIEESYEDEASVVYLYSIRPNEPMNSEEDWDN
jgi:hypothetical protein